MECTVTDSSFISGLLQGGAAGVVVLVVILFLRHTAIMRAEDRHERAEERKTWEGMVNKLTDRIENNTSATARIAEAVALATKVVEGCPNNGRAK